VKTAELFLLLTTINQLTLFMLRIFITLFFTLSLFFTGQNAYAEEQVNAIRVSHSKEYSRIVFDASNTLHFKTGFLTQPNRYFIDIKNGVNKASLPVIKNNSRISTLRYSKLDNGYIRFTVLAKKNLNLKHFQLGANKTYGHRLVVDFSDDGKASITNVPSKKSEEQTIEEIFSSSGKPTKQTEQQKTPQPTKKSVVKKPKPIVKSNLKKSRKTIIAIDAGHGGADPGAIGARKTKEKYITLSISKRVAALINKNPKFKAVLTRNGDYFVRLRSRTTKARKAEADLFVSIHADAALNRNARGMSVFALSQRGASSELARAIARKQNQADLIGGVSIKDKDDDLAKVLLDLSMTNKISESVDLGKSILRKLAPLGKLHSKRVEQAGFAVLKSPDIPSVLVETGFISNKHEEKLLKTSSHQKKLAKAIYLGIISYVENNPSQFDYTSTHQITESQAPYQGSYTGESNTGENVSSQASSDSYITYKVKSGNSLSVIAQRYGVSVSQIKQWNNLKSDIVQKGQRLKIKLNGSSSSNAPTLVAKKTITYRVKSGDTLSGIADKHSLTMPELKSQNRLKGNQVYIGQKLKITTTKSTAHSAEISRTHKVRSGESLSSISAKYNITINTLKRLNGLRNSTLYKGQVLRLTSSSGSSGSSSNRNIKKTITHKVTRGQTLSGLSSRYGVKMSDIVKWNKLKKRELFIGQRLTIKNQ